MSKCPNCGYESDSENKFCPKCGQKQTIRCPKCGNETSSENDFCPECGNKLSDNQEDYNKSDTTTKVIPQQKLTLANTMFMANKRKKINLKEVVE